MVQKLFNYSSVDVKKIGLLVSYLEDIKDKLDDNLRFVRSIKKNIDAKGRERAVNLMTTDTAQDYLNDLEDFHKKITVMMQILSDIEVSVQRGIIKGTVIPDLR